MTTSKRPKLKLVLQPAASCDNLGGTNARSGGSSSNSSRAGGKINGGDFALTRKLSEDCGRGGGGSRAGTSRVSPSSRVWLLPDFAQPSDSASECQLWCDRYAPASREELCLHKRKLDELADWLRGCGGGGDCSPARLLFVHGPCGAGKSTAVRVLCAGLGVSLACLDDELDGAGGNGGGGSVGGEGQEFDGGGGGRRSGDDALQALLRLARFGGARVILWDEPPCSLATSGGGFSGSGGFGDPVRAALDQFRTRCPNASLVVVSCNERLLSRDWLEERRVDIVQVNPVARTQLLRCLNSLLTRRRLQPAAHKALVEAVADASDGDMRAAVSGLQFSLQFAATRATVNSKRGSRPQGTQQQQTMLFRDTPYQLFHAVGKLLHAKRSETPPKDSGGPPTLLTEPEAVSERSALPAELLVAFLQANAAGHFASGAVEPLARLADEFAFADRLCAAWTTEADAKAHAISLASRALAYRLHGNRAPNQFRPIRKPPKLPPPGSVGGGLSGTDAFYAPACIRQRLAAATAAASGGLRGPDSAIGEVRFVICSERDAELEATIVDD